MSEFRRFQIEQGRWSDTTFGLHNSPEGCIAHLAKEVKELAANPYDLTEQADCLMLLLDANRRSGFTADDLLAAAWDKLEVCRGREWAKPGADGSVEHVRHAGDPTLHWCIPCSRAHVVGACVGTS